MLGKRYNLTAVIEKDKDGFFAFAPELQGCYTQGDTYEEAISNLAEAVRGHLLDLKANRQELPMASHLVSLTRLEVAV